MNEEEREIVKKFERLYLKDFNNEKITNEDRLSYIECALMTNLIEKLQKENEELKEENEYNKILLDMNNNFTIDKKTGNYKWNVIEIQKVKDKIEEYKKLSDKFYVKFLESDRYNTDIREKGIKCDAIILALEELIEEREVKEKWINIKQLKD